MDSSIVSNEQLISFISNAVYACRLTCKKLIFDDNECLSGIEHSELCNRINIAHNNLLAISSNLVKINDILRMSEGFYISDDPLFQA